MKSHDPDPEPPGGRTSELSTTTVDGLSRWLIRRAAHSAPAELSERLEEEWLADVASRATPFARLRFALGCCRAIRVIASDWASAAVAVAAPAPGGRITLPRLDGNTNFLRRNSLTVVAVIAFHVAILYALMAGLGIEVTQIIPSTFQTPLVPDTRPVAPPPSLPRPVITSTVLPLPELPPASYPDEPHDGLSLSPQEPASAPTGLTATHEVRRVGGGPGAGFPATDDFYPSAAKRLEEQGISTVRVCVDPDGRLTSAPTTVQSSGYPRLDEGAIRLAVAGSGHYRASTEDGVAVKSCYAFRVRFELRN